MVLGKFRTSIHHCPTKKINKVIQLNILGAVTFFSGLWNPSSVETIESEPKGSEKLGGLHPQGDPLASPMRNFNLILSSSSNGKAKFKSILPHTHGHIWMCVTSGCRSLQEPINQETFHYDNNCFSFGRSLPSYFKAEWTGSTLHMWFERTNDGY